MTDQIVSKLNSEIVKGIHTEPQALYILAEIRKIIERDFNKGDTAENFRTLMFYCNWVLHNKLKGEPAREVVNIFKEPHSLLLQGKDIPRNDYIYDILKLKELKSNLSRFLKAHDIPDFTDNADNWCKYMFLYFNIVSDCPLLILENDANDSFPIKKVTIKLEQVIHEGQNVFKVSWYAEDRSGAKTNQFVINAYSI